MAVGLTAPAVIRSELVDGCSAATALRCSPSLRAVVPMARGPAVVACLATYGGGLVGGDRLELELAAGAGSTLAIGSQSTTKVYRCPDAPAELTATAQVGGGALLAMLPEPTSLFAGSRYRQRIAIDCAAGASLAWLDAVSAGRVAGGEVWRQEAYDARLELRSDGRLLARDALRLDPPLAAERLAGAAVVATLWLLGPRCADAAAAAADLAAAHRPGERGLWLGWSRLPGGGVLRAAAAAHETCTHAVRAATAPLDPQFGGAPWRRLASVELACT